MHKERESLTNLVWVVYDGQLAVGLFYLALVSILVDAENLVIILPLALLEFEFSITNLLCDARFFGVSLLNCL